MWPCQSIRVQHWLFEWQQPILLDYAARSSACIVSDEAMISECSVDAYAHELSALTIVHTYSARSKKCSEYYRAPHEIIGIFRSILRPSLHYISSSPSHEFCVLTLSIVQRLSFCNNGKKNRVFAVFLGIKNILKNMDREKNSFVKVFINLVKSRFENIFLEINM